MILKTLKTLIKSLILKNRSTVPEAKKYLPLAVVMVLILTGRAFAGTDGSEFQNIYELITGWTTGYLGKTIAIGMFLTGMGVGIIRQSLMSIVAGIAGGMGVAYTPDVIENIVTALIF